MAIQVDGANRIQPQSSSNTFVTNQSFQEQKSLNQEHLQNLQKGEILEGKVIQTGENSITLEVNGKLVEAKLEGRFEFVQGEMVRLSVVDAGAEKILLKSLMDTQMVSEKRVEDILKQLNLKISPENKEMIQELMGAKLPLSQENLRILQIMMQKYPKVPVRNMVLLLKNDIPLNDKNIQELQKTQNPNELLASRLDDLIGKLSKLMQSEKGNFFFTQIMEENTQGQKLIDYLKAVADGSEQEFVADEKLVLKEFLNKAELDSLGKEIEAMLQNLPKTEGQSTNVRPELQSLFQQFGEEFFASENLKAYQDVLLHLKQGILNGDIRSVEELFAQAKELPAELKEVLRNIITEKLSMGILRKELLLGIKEKEPAAQLEKLYEKLGQLKNTEDSSVVVKNILQDVLSARESMNFMAKFQNNAGFLQLPFLLGDKVLNGELFVLNNKKGRKKSDGNEVSALLQLDFVTLGHVDTFIRKEANRIQIDFYAEDKEKETWLREKTYLLNNRLIEKDYQVVAINTYTKKEKTDGFADFLANEQVKKVSRFSFDMRA